MLFKLCYIRRLISKYDKREAIILNDITHFLTYKECFTNWDTINFCFRFVEVLFREFNFTTTLNRVFDIFRYKKDSVTQGVHYREVLLYEYIYYV